MRFIDEHRHDRIDGREFGVEPICRVLSEHGCPIAPSTYYAAKARPACDRVIRDAELLAQIRRVHADNYGVYGARKVWHQLHREGIPVARCTVERLMRRTGCAAWSAARRRRTTKPDAAATGRPIWWSGSSGAAAEPAVGGRLHLRRRPGPAASTWRSSSTCSPGMIIGWRRRDRMRTDLALDALEMAIWTRAAPAHAFRGWSITPTRARKADSSGRRNTSMMEVLRWQDDSSGCGDRALRPAMRSPGRAGAGARCSGRSGGDRQGATTEDAAAAVGVSPPVGTRWFRHAGGMPPISLGRAHRPLPVVR